eukprot:9503596-Pyramimonas_sp.AAC.1
MRNRRVWPIPGVGRLRAADVRRREVLDHGLAAPARDLALAGQDAFRGDADAHAAHLRASSTYSPKLARSN